MKLRNEEVTEHTNHIPFVYFFKFDFVDHWYTTFVLHRLRNLEKSVILCGSTSSYIIFGTQGNKIKKNGAEISYFYH